MSFTPLEVISLGLQTATFSSTAAIGATTFTNNWKIIAASACIGSIIGVHYSIEGTFVEYIIGKIKK